MRSIAKSRFLILESNAKSENGFHIREICPQDERVNPDFMDSFLLVDWEIRKRICKTILLNSGLLFANYACTC